MFVTFSELDRFMSAIVFSLFIEIDEPSSELHIPFHILLEFS